MKRKKKIIYIMHPYSSDPEGNYQDSLKVCNFIFNLGAIAINPLSFHEVDKIQHREYDEWMRADLQLLELCDAGFRVQGHSMGCDEEMMFCVKNEIPVYFDTPESIESLKKFIES